MGISMDHDNRYSEGELPEVGLGAEERESVREAGGADPLKAYLKEMRSAALLTKEEEVELAKKIEEGEAAIARELLRSGALIKEVRRLKETIGGEGPNQEEVQEEVSEILGGDEQEAEDVLAALDEFDRIYRSFSMNSEGSRKEEERLIEILISIEKRIGIYGSVLERLRDGGEERMIRVLEARRAEIERTKDYFIKANLRLVMNIARKYQNRGLPLLDLIQEGNIGLMRAVERYEYQRGYRFSTYATWWIRQSILRAISEQARTIRIPHHMMETMNRLIRLSNRIVQESGREPTPEELAEKINLPAERVKEVMNIVKEPVSLETPADDSGERTLKGLIEDKGMTLPHEEMISNELADELKEVLSTLSPKEEQVLRMRFGIGEQKRYSLDEIGDRLKLSRERVRQIEAKALRKLRHPKHVRKLGIFYER